MIAKGFRRQSDQHDNSHHHGPGDRSVDPIPVDHENDLSRKGFDIRHDYLLQ